MTRLFFMIAEQKILFEFFKGKAKTVNMLQLIERCLLSKIRISRAVIQVDS